jgi:glycerophosphoryl diester phosphodiesterase
MTSFPLWIAHSSAGKLAPENTLAALRLGANRGQRAFGCDVKLSADGVPFLLADAKLGSTTTAEGSVTVSATYWPAERAYLMHYSSRLSKGEITAASIPAMVGVNIEWVHATEAASTAAATAMVSGYGIAFPPALVSNHARRTAIDMTIRNMVGKSIVDAAGTSIGITRLSDLNAVGATFGVIKLASDPPHWSEDGH